MHGNAPTPSAERSPLKEGAEPMTIPPSPYESPQAPTPPGGYPPPARKPGPVKQVPIVAVLMIVQGALVGLLGLVFLIFGPLALLGALDQGGSQPPPAAMGVLFILLALFLLASGGLLIFAGVRNRKYRSRSLGLVALGVGTLASITCYCAPTALGLLIYGLVVYLNSDVRYAFELGERGATADEIVRTVHG